MVKNSKFHIQRTLKHNLSLKSQLIECFSDAYYSARLLAAQETGLDEKVFPIKSPWTPTELFPELKSSMKKKT